MRWGGRVEEEMWVGLKNIIKFSVIFLLFFLLLSLFTVSFSRFSFFPPEASVFLRWTALPLSWGGEKTMTRIRRVRYMRWEAEERKGVEKFSQKNNKLSVLSCFAPFDVIFYLFIRKNRVHTRRSAASHFQSPCQIFPFDCMKLFKIGFICSRKNNNIFLMNLLHQLRLTLLATQITSFLFSAFVCSFYTAHWEWSTLLSLSSDSENINIIIIMFSLSRRRLARLLHPKRQPFAKHREWMSKWGENNQVTTNLNDPPLIMQHYKRYLSSLSEWKQWHNGEHDDNEWKLLTNNIPLTLPCTQSKSTSTRSFKAKHDKMERVGKKC